MTTRELLRSVAEDMDMCAREAVRDGLPVTAGIYREREAALRAIVDRFDAEMGDAKVNLERAETRGDEHARRAFYVAGMLLARLDAPVARIGAAGPTKGTR